MNNKHTIIVLFDGGCSLCQKSVKYLSALDRFDRLQLVDFCNTSLRNTYAPEISDEDLREAMHIKMKDGSIYKGFDAFRKIAWRLPAIKIFTPLLYIPGIPLIGRMVYKKIADSRYKCADGDCSHKT